MEKENDDDDEFDGDDDVSSLGSEEPELFCISYSRYFNDLLKIVKNVESNRSQQYTTADLFKDIQTYFNSHSLDIKDKRLRTLTGWLLSYNRAILEQRNITLKSITEVPEMQRPSYQETMESNAGLCRFSNLNTLFLNQLLDLPSPNNEDRVFVVFVNKDADDLNGFFNYNYASKYISQVCSDTIDILPNVDIIKKINETERLIEYIKSNDEQTKIQTSIWQNESKPLITPFGSTNIAREDELELVGRGYIPHLTKNIKDNGEILSDLSNKFGHLALKLSERSGTYIDRYPSGALPGPTQPNNNNNNINANKNVQPKPMVFLDDDDFSQGKIESMFTVRDIYGEESNTVTKNGLISRFDGDTTKDNALQVNIPLEDANLPPLWGDQPGWIKEAAYAAFTQEFESIPEDADEQNREYQPEIIPFDYSTQEKVAHLLATSMIPLDTFIKMSPSIEIPLNVEGIEEWYDAQDRLNGLSCIWSPNGTPSNGRMVYYNKNINDGGGGGGGGNNGISLFKSAIEMKDFPAEDIPSQKPNIYSVGEPTNIINQNQVEVTELKYLWNTFLKNAVGVLSNKKRNTTIILLDAIQHSPLLPIVSASIPKKGTEQEQNELKRRTLQFLNELVYSYAWHTDLRGTNKQSPFNSNSALEYANELILDVKSYKLAISVLVREITRVTIKELRPNAYNRQNDTVLNIFRKNLTRTNIILYNIIKHDTLMLIRNSNFNKEDNIERAFRWLRKYRKLRLANVIYIFDLEKQYDETVKNSLQTVSGLYGCAAWAQHFMENATRGEIDELNPHLFSTDISSKKKRKREKENIVNVKSLPVPKSTIINDNDDDDELMKIDDDDSNKNIQQSNFEGEKEDEEEEEEEEISEDILQDKRNQKRIKFTESLFRKIAAGGNNDNDGGGGGDKKSKRGRPRKKRKRSDEEEEEEEKMEYQTINEDDPDYNIPLNINPEIKQDPWRLFEIYVAQIDPNIGIIRIEQAKLEDQKWPISPIRYSSLLIETLRNQLNTDNIASGSELYVFTEEYRIISPATIFNAKSSLLDEPQTTKKGKEKERESRTSYLSVAPGDVYSVLLEFENIMKKWLEYASKFRKTADLKGTRIIDEFIANEQTKVVDVLNTIRLYKIFIKPIDTTSQISISGSNIVKNRRRKLLLSSTSDITDNTNEDDVKNDNVVVIDSKKNQNECTREFKPAKIKAMEEEIIGLNSILSKLYTEVGLRSQYDYNPYIKIDPISGLELNQHLQQNSTSTSSISEAELSTSLYKKPMESLLLYGPPGVGKTAVVRVFASVLLKSGIGTFLFAESATVLRGSYIGQTAANIVCLFETAENAAKKAESDANITITLTKSTSVPKTFMSIVFLDEFEIIAKERTDGGGGGGGAAGGDGAKDESQAATNALLTVLDGVSQYPHVIFVAATNIPTQIDTALRRRFRHMILVDTPTDISREIKLHMDIYKTMLPHPPGGAELNIRKWLTVFQDTTSTRERMQRDNLYSFARGLWEPAVQHYTKNVDNILNMIGVVTNNNNNNNNQYIFGAPLTAQYISNSILPRLSRKTISLSAVFKKLDIQLAGISAQQTSASMPYSTSIMSMTSSTTTIPSSGGISGGIKPDINIVVDTNWFNNLQQKAITTRAQSPEQIKQIKQTLRTDLEIRLLELDGPNSARYNLISNFFQRNKSNIDLMKQNPRAYEPGLISQLSNELNDLDSKSLSPLGYTLSDVTKLTNQAFQNTFTRALVMPVPISVLASWGVYGIELQNVFNNDLLNGKQELNTEWWISFAKDHNRGSKFKEHISAYLRLASERLWGNMRDILSSTTKTSSVDDMDVANDSKSGNTSKTLLDLILTINMGADSNLWKNIILNQAFVFLPASNVEWSQIRSALIESTSNSQIPINWNELQIIANNLFVNFSYYQRQKLVLAQFITENDFELALKSVKSTSSLAIYAQAVQFENDPEVAIRDARSSIGPYVNNNNTNSV